LYYWRSDHFFFYFYRWSNVVSFSGLSFLFHCPLGVRNRVPVKCETKSKRNSPKRNEIYRNETKLTETKRNGIIQNEIKPILTKRFLGEIQDKN
jgi:hypothetical protein